MDAPLIRNLLVLRVAVLRSSAEAPPVKRYGAFLH